MNWHCHCPLGCGTAWVCDVLIAPNQLKQAVFTSAILSFPLWLGVFSMTGAYSAKEKDSPQMRCEHFQRLWKTHEQIHVAVLCSGTSEARVMWLLRGCSGSWTQFPYSSVPAGNFSLFSFVLWCNQVQLWYKSKDRGHISWRGVFTLSLCDTYFQLPLNVLDINQK